ncbi:hypothetical protein Dimus_019869 [Dionaea muscipula]
MDLKGISWVGDMYEMFEAMCLKVEETIYEDTVQYVENQARTVGACLEKFYSDVMQDLLPEPCSDPIKADNPGERSANFADAGSYKKPKVVTKKEPVNAKKAVRKFSVSSNIGKQLEDIFSSDISTANNLRKSLPEDTTEDQYGGTQISTLGSYLASVCEKGGVREQTADTNECVAPVPCDAQSTDMNLDEIGNKRIELKEPQNGVLPSEDDRWCSSCKSMRNVDGEPYLPETGRPSFTTEINLDDYEDLGVEVGRNLDGVNLGESCILVDKNEQYDFPHLPGKRRSYKKKFRDALFSRSKFLKSREHEQLSGQRRKSPSSTPMTNSDSGERNSETLDSCESDWELL